jgi:asparagine synthase (glutamine-hydrolysing)
MATQSGVMFFDTRPTDEPCRALAAGLESVAPDGVFSIAESGIAMAFGACHVWTGEQSCRQPYRSASYIVTWDGRLDNRDDLLMRLDGRLAKDMSDVAIATSVFERWGIDGLGSLVGDWSIAIWDSRARVLHLARDYMGVRPLYYYVGDDAVMWSTSLGELATRSGRVDDLNEAFVARFITLQFSTDVTPYKAIRAVPTATCVSMSDAGIETRRRFWYLEPGVIRHRQPRQYEEQLRALWMDAVGARLQTSGAVWAELSGGLDSSSVVCMADLLIKGGRVPANCLQTICHVTLESPEGDERPFVAEVDTWTGRRTAIVGVEAHSEERNHDWDWVTPLAPRDVKARSIRHVHEEGGRLVLSGRLGDAIMGCAPDNSVAVFDDLAGLHLRAALSNMRQWSRACRKPFLETAWGLVCEAIGRGLGSSTDVPGAAVLVPNLRAYALEPATSRDPARAVRLAQRQQARSILFYMLQGRLENWVGKGAVAEVHPFAHRPLVEYLLAIPGDELSAPGNTRSLMRRAFAGLVPDRILRRTSKGHYAPAALRAARVRSKALPPIEQLECVERGWIDPQRLSAAVCMLDVGGSDALLNVQRVLRVERWLASRNRRGPAVIPKGKEVTTNDVCIA